MRTLWMDESSEPTKKRNDFDWWSCWFEQIRRENKILMDIDKASILWTKDVTATIS